MTCCSGLAKQLGWVSRTAPELHIAPDEENSNFLTAGDRRDLGLPTSQTSGRLLWSARTHVVFIVRMACRNAEVSHPHPARYADRLTRLSKTYTTVKHRVEQLRPEAQLLQAYCPTPDVYAAPAHFLPCHEERKPSSHPAFPTSPRGSVHHWFVDMA